MKVNTERVIINKAAGDEDEDALYRLTDIEPQFVSLVTAGANRQKKFQVVKADEGDGTGKPTSKGTGEAEPVAGDVNEPDGKGEPTDGQNVAGDFNNWLDDVSKSVSMVLEDAQVTEILSADATVADTLPEQPPTQQSIDKSSDKVEKAFAQLQAEFADEIAKNKTLKGTVEKQASEIVTLRKQIAAVKADRNKYRSKAAKLRNGVGGTTALMTGNVTDVDKQSADGEPEDAAWASGGDLSAKATK